MKKWQQLILIITITSFIGTSLAFKLKRISYVYVTTSPGFSDACTVLLYDFTLVDNGQAPVTRKASSIPVSVGCRLVSIYPDGDGNGSNF